MPYVDVAIDVPIGRAFTYRVSEEASAKAVRGMRVLVPFRNKTRIGYIVDIKDSEIELSRIKNVSGFPDEATSLSKEMLKLIGWVSTYYASPIGETVSCALPNLLNRANETEKKRNTVKKHDLEKFHKKGAVDLNDDQVRVLKEIEKIYSTGKFATALLHGVTGSGKTELYIRLIENVLKDGKDSILLVPEILMTPQLAGRIISHFGDIVAVYHSGLTDAQRLSEWKKMRSGEAKIVVGTRSAIFAPFQNVGTIIIDEEHDNSYKQEDSPRYNARDTAIMRGKIGNALVVLGSATPSLESLANAKSNKFHYIHLPERHGVAVMPDIEIVDMRKEVRSQLLNPNLSIKLMSELESVMKKKQQAILFLNRRGFANFFICRDCGHIPECPNCGISLTYHREKGSEKGARHLQSRVPGTFSEPFSNGTLICHYCDYSIPSTSLCPKCKGSNFDAIGSGTEQIEDIIREKLPMARIERLDRDTATTEKKRREILSKMKHGEIDILIGTQMVTKGHDFPNVTLVGIISADQSIHFPDFRSAERTFQLITQVSGRAGRDIHAGKVIIQTYSPEHLSIVTAGANDLTKFIETELETRKELSYPPFSRLANIRIVGPKEDGVAKTAKNLAKFIAEISTDHMKILGPSPAPLEMIRGKYRWQILLKSASAKALSETLSKIQSAIDNKPPKNAQISIDVDPVGMM